MQPPHIPDWVILLIILGIGAVAGGINERRHYRSIARRERELMRIPAISDRHMPDLGREVEAVAFVCGSMVVSVDYFKRFMGWMRGLVGGEVRSFETLIDRARREAVLRMKELAPDADFFVGVRIENVSVSAATGRDNIGSAEAIAYGTAIRFKR